MNLDLILKPALYLLIHINYCLLKVHQQANKNLRQVDNCGENTSQPPPPPPPHPAILPLPPHATTPVSFILFYTSLVFFFLFLFCLPGSRPAMPTGQFVDQRERKNDTNTSITPTHTHTHTDTHTHTQNATISDYNC